MHTFLLELSDPIGLLGVILILIAYLFVTTGAWSSHRLLYQLLNFIGAWMILFSLDFHWNTASVVIEIAWIIISSIGIYRAIYGKKIKTE